MFTLPKLPYAEDALEPHIIWIITIAVRIL